MTHENKNKQHNKKLYLVFLEEYQSGKKNSAELKSGCLG